MTKAKELKAEDMPKMLKVKVTGEDIREGVAGSPDSCAIARACKNNMVITQELVIATSHSHLKLGLIAKFDADEKVKPETFVFKKVESFVFKKVE